MIAHRSPGARFLLGFALQDLLDGRGLGTTTVLTLTVALVTALTTLALGLPGAAEQVFRRQLRDRPLAQCLLVWEPDRIASHPLTPSRMQTLRTALADKLTLPADAVRCFPFHESRLTWQRNPAGGPLVFEPDIRGRTLVPGDPFLKNCRLRSGRPFADDTEEGVVVADGFLERLGYPADLEAGATLHVASAGSGRPVPVTLVGVLAHPLPFSFAYVMTEAGERNLRSQDPDREAATIWTGPIHEKWPAPRQLPRAVEDALNDYLIARPRRVERDGGVVVWELNTLRSPPPRVSLWKEQLEELHKRLQEQFPASPGFVEKFEARVEKRPLPPRTGHDLAEVYVDDLSQLSSAAQGIRAAHLETDQGVVLQMEAYAEASRAAERVLLWVVVVVSVIAVVNVFALQTLRVQRKAVEVGMLRAMGMDGPVLLAVYTLEGALLWLSGSLLGLGLAAAVGASLGAYYAPGEWVELLTAEWGRQVALFLGGAALVCCLATVAAVLRPLLGAPARALSGP